MQNTFTKFKNINIYITLFYNYYYFYCCRCNYVINYTCGDVKGIVHPFLSLLSHCSKPVNLILLLNTKENSLKNMVNKQLITLTSIPLCVFFPYLGELSL